jgi:membrane fusion protein, multidrug efflux system
MKKTYILVTLLAFLASCNQGGSDLETKKKELDEARKEYQDLKEKIDAMEKELSELDPEFAKETDKAILVSTFSLEKKSFAHQIEVRGSVASRKNVLISAETSGTIKRVHVKEGQRVTKGQVLVTLDADVIRNSISELKTQLELATSIYEKQSRLWDQKIGTEVQYLQAKNNKETLERRLATTNSQLDLAVVKAPFSGTVDEIPARQGELASPGIPLIRITSQQDMYIRADVSERFIGSFAAGDMVAVYFPVQDKNVKSTIASVSQIINPDNRTFAVEVNLPKTDWILKPNQVTVLRLTDYVNREAFVVPTRLIQVDRDGQYVYQAEKKGNQYIARKLRVKSGVSYDGFTEITEGVKEGDQLVDKGFRDLTEGVQIAIATAMESVKVVAEN